MAAKVCQGAMFIKIDRGLFKFDITDHHAVLGVPVDADVKDIRKRYLKIARHLHPDSCNAQSEAGKQLASQLFSKLVNPAYETLSHDRSRAEYILVLKQIGLRLVQESPAIELKSEVSKQLNQTNNINRDYKTSLDKLTEKQYDSFDQVLQLIAQISELNLVYLMRQGGKAFQLPPPPVGSKTNSGEKIKDTPPPLPSPQLEQESVVEQYLRRAQTLIEKNNFAQATVELKYALKLEPNNSRCHSLMGAVYLKQNQITMAKVHFERALKLNPKDQTALEGKQSIDQLGQKANVQATAPPKSNSGKPSDKSGGNGLLGGLFGGKKK